MNRAFAGCVGILLVAVAACGGGGSSSSNDPHHVDPNTEGTSIVIGIQAEDFRQTITMPLLELRVEATIEGIATPVAQTVSPDALPYELVIKPPAGKLDAKVDVKLEGYIENVMGQRGGEPMLVVSRLASTRFVAKEKRLLRLRLEARCAFQGPPIAGGGIFLGPKCDAPQTCIAAKCQDSALPSSALEPYVADWDTKGPDACRPEKPGDPEVTLGTGETDYVDLADGAEVQAVEGPQCGHHVWIGVKMKNLRQSGTKTTITSVQPGSGLVGPVTSFAYGYGAADAGSCTLAGLRYQLDSSGKIDAYLGKPLDITVELVDTTGGKKSVTKHVQIAPTVKPFGNGGLCRGGGPG